ncbi:MAG: Murein hydrolase activator EnvC [Rhodocyclaceae bacterium]|nr:MAG: peptidoglycan DD-metalloendopeptidase family protein [Rhodocyclaceae bacterium]MBE7424005.1 peptidoglycan DD-metalloendopeptidase family protein [Zoogloeaceae bacterium]MBV6407623.1 Murein hydrolase activator EnvC [Rhodocyclaceae bacterium]MCK6383322.1 peptidoglycan DD-metalloendopeptidase family protein [Rhodocyclaceae bacterium]
MQGRIQALQKDIASTEESRADAAEELRETEQAISETNRRLRALAGERTEVQAALGRLNGQSQQLSARIAAHQAQLGRLFTRQFYAGEADALSHFLSGNDSNQLARDAYYLTLLSRAKAGLIRDLGRILEEKKRLAEEAGAKSAELAGIESRQQRERAGLIEQQQKRQAVLARLAERIKAQRSEVVRLRRDEKRLAKLIAELGRRAAPVKPPLRAREPSLRNERTPDAMPAADAFARLKGRLALPVRGELANRFGAPRQEGGTAWKGVFIRAPGGAEVKAIATGRVVFSDWLRGFGNLAIVDHGDGYLSVYGNNESLFKTAGQAVKGGEAIASVGNSGGNPETGLYFELRHLGQALDPLKWVGLK